MKNNIKKIIEEDGLKITFLIENTGLSKSAIYDIINGKSVPNLLNARKICKVLNRDVDQVFPNDKFEEDDLNG